MAENMEQGLLQEEPQAPEAPVEEEKDSNGLPKNYAQQVNKLTAMAMSIIYSSKVNIEQSHIPQALEDAEANVQYQDDAAPTAIAEVSMWVLDQVETSIEKRGGKVTPLVVMGAIGRIVAETVELATVAKLVKMSDEDLQIAIATAINKYIPRAKAEGKVTDQQLQEAATALQKAYPKEAENFKQMVQKRLEKQVSSKGPVNEQLEMTANNEESAPPPSQTGLLQGGQNGQ